MANQISIPKVQTSDRNVNQLQQNIINAVNQLQSQVNTTNSNVTTLQQPAGAPTSTIVKSKTTGATGGVYSTSLAPLLDVNGAPLTVTVTTTGGDVEIGFQADGISNGSGWYVDQSPTDAGVEVNIYRNSIQILNYLIYLQNNVSIEIHEHPASVIRYIDSPPAGTWTYTVQCQTTNNPRSTNSITNSVLYARPY